MDATPTPSQNLLDSGHPNLHLSQQSEVPPTWATSRFAKETQDWFTRMGAIFPRIFIQCLDSSLDYFHGGHWMKEHKFFGFKRVVTKEEIFNFMAKKYANSKLLYLEFGVHEGARILEFSKMLENEQAKFHGFDSFLGLPEGWNSFHKRGHFSTGGVIPQTADKRISFFKGTFNEVLPTYQLPDHEILFINIDCDLYSSTSTVLDALASQIKPGTCLYFDEFYDRNHERKAFEEFIEYTGYKFKCLMSTKGLTSVLFQRIS